MIPSQKTKQAYESLIFTIDASDTVATGDAIATDSLDIDVFDSDGTEVTSTMIEGTPSFSGTDISVQIKAGTAGENYNMRVRFTTDNGEAIEDDLLIIVKEKDF